MCPLIERFQIVVLSIVQTLELVDRMDRTCVSHECSCKSEWSASTHGSKGTASESACLRECVKIVVIILTGCILVSHSGDLTLLLILKSFGGVTGLANGRLVPLRRFPLLGVSDTWVCCLHHLGESIAILPSMVTTTMKTSLPIWDETTARCGSLAPILVATSGGFGSTSGRRCPGSG